MDYPTAIPPALVLGTLLASVHAFLFHALVAYQRHSPVLYWVAGLAGFGLGQAVGDVTGLWFLMAGDVHIVEGTVGAWLLLSAVRAWWP